MLVFARQHFEGGTTVRRELDTHLYVGRHARRVPRVNLVVRRAGGTLILRTGLFLRRWVDRFGLGRRLG
jgi:hypothetical protein